MTKRLIIICLFLLATTGLKAQIYCYHCYKIISVSKDGRQKALPIFTNYRYFTFQGDLLFEYSLPGKASKKDNMAWKYNGMRNNGHLVYFKYYRNIFGKYDELVEFFDKDRYDLCYVSDDRNLICIVEDGIHNYYERCPDWNCK